MPKIPLTNHHSTNPPLTNHHQSPPITTIHHHSPITTHLSTPHQSPNFHSPLTFSSVPKKGRLFIFFNGNENALKIFGTMVLYSSEAR